MVDDGFCLADEDSQESGVLLALAAILLVLGVARLSQARIASHGTQPWQPLAWQLGLDFPGVPGKVHYQPDLANSIGIPTHKVPYCT